MSYIPVEVEHQVRADAGHRCGYCRASEAITSLPLTFDHLIPTSLGGPTTHENLWLACERCNRHKSDQIGGIDLDTGTEASLFNPRTQVWREHFRWNADGAEIIGLTPTGRVTVAALKLNRPLAVTARRWWVRAGFHPPLD